MSIEVRIPTILRRYTDEARIVEGKGETLGDLFFDLDTRFTGMPADLVTRDTQLGLAWLRLRTAPI